MKPTIQNISNPENAFKWTLFHVLLGVTTAFVPWLFILFFYAVAYANFKMMKLEARKGRMEFPILLYAYMLSFDILAKLTKSSPFIPVEYSKYTMVALGLYLIWINPRKSERVGWLLLFLLIPSLFFDLSGSRTWADIVNNFFGPAGLAIGVALFGFMRPTPKLINSILRLVWLPMTSIVVCMFIKTPEFDDMNFQLAANVVTTGGVSSNQASTMLGIGMFLSFYSMYSSQKYSGFWLVDCFFLVLFALQGLLSFSRGGMLVGLIAILIVVFTSSASSKPGRSRSGGLRWSSFLYLALGVLFLTFTYKAVDELTGGKLTLRYQGETEGTAAGYAEKDMSRMTSGRSGIWEGDIAIFKSHPFFGGGAGSSGHLRALYDGFYIAPHIELSRLLSEQGLLGLLYFLILMYIGWKSWDSRQYVHSGNLLFILYVIGILTSFHSSMRTFITPYFIAVSAMGINANVKSKKVPR